MFWLRLDELIHLGPEWERLNRATQELTGEMAMRYYENRCAVAPQQERYWSF